MWSCGSLEWLDQRKEWLDLKTIICVGRTTEVKGKSSSETRYFISSLPSCAERLDKAVRDHWSVENELHWHLDVSFDEDRSRVRAGDGAENLSTVRRMVLNLLKEDKNRSTGKMANASLKNQRFLAGWNREYLLRLIATNDK